MSPGLSQSCSFATTGEASLVVTDCSAERFQRNWYLLALVMAQHVLMVLMAKHLVQKPKSPGSRLHNFCHSCPCCTPSLQLIPTTPKPVARGEASLRLVSLLRLLGFVLCFFEFKESAYVRATYERD